MNVDDALRKIKKCLALAADRAADANVAASAMRQAQALMAEFGIVADDARLSDVCQAEGKAPTKKTTRWEAALARAIASALGCELMWNQTAVMGARLSITDVKVVFIGIGSSASIAAYAWDVLARQCVKARKAHMAKQPARCKTSTLTARGDMFAYGWVLTATATLKDLAVSESQRALMCAYKQQAFPDSTSFKPADRAKGRNVSTNDFADGLQAGRDARLARAIAGTSRQLLGAS